MSRRPVEQALATLLPTHADELPPELVSLSLSLVAQSRSFASSLKPEEEIARPYACAEIACKRLSRVLKLPPLLGRPPCPPRPYKRLYTFLDQSLAQKAATTAPSTPSKTVAESSAVSTTAAGLPFRTPSTRARAAGSLPSTPTESTPSKKRALNGTPKSTAASAASFGRALTTPQRAHAKPPRQRTAGLSNSITIIPDAPGWVLAAIRTMCKALSSRPDAQKGALSGRPVSETLPPHLFAGASTVLHFVSRAVSQDREGDHFATVEGEESAAEFLRSVLRAHQAQTDITQPDDDYRQIIHALIVALYMIYLSRQQRSLDASADDESGGRRREIDDPAVETQQVALASLGLRLTGRRPRPQCAQVEHWRRLIADMGWAVGQDWLENIPWAKAQDSDTSVGEGADVGTGHNMHDDDDDDDVNGDFGVVSASKLRVNARSVAQRAKAKAIDAARPGLLPGLGTMMQDRVDWLADHRREEFLEWKAEMLGRIEEMRKTSHRDNPMIPAQV